MPESLVMTAPSLILSPWPPHGFLRVRLPPGDLPPPCLALLAPQPSSGSQGGIRSLQLEKVALDPGAEPMGPGPSPAGSSRGPHPPSTQGPWGVPSAPCLSHPRRPGRARSGLPVSPQVKISYFGQPARGALGHSVLYLTGAGESRIWSNTAPALSPPRWLLEGLREAHGRLPRPPRSLASSEAARLLQTPSTGAPAVLTATGT